jgi:OOP family OmpA-OmpF porin
MNIKKISLLTGLSTALLLGSITVAHAQSPGLYLGAAAGVYSVNDSDFDSQENLRRTYLGVQFTEGFAIEGSWTDFNRVDSGSDRFEADGKGLAAVFSLPLGLFVKGGQFWWDANSNFGGTVADDDGSDMFWGVGWKFAFTDHVALRLDVERYDVADVDLETASAGIEIRF